MKKQIAVMVMLSIHTLLHAQNVGIGTTTPTEKLHVIGNIKTDTVKANVLQLTPNAGVGKILTADATGNGTWQLNTATVKALNGLTRTTDSIMLGGLLQTNTAIRLNANSLTITDTGSTATIPISQASFPLAIALSNTATTQSFTAVNNTNLVSADIYVAALSGTAITIQLKDNTGNILATATNPFPSSFTGFSTFNYNGFILNSGQLYNLSITSAANTQIYYDNNNPYASGSSSIGPSADIAFRISAIDEKNALTVKAGKIGINNNNPTAGLDITGTVKINDGTNGVGKVLTSDAAGKASWQAISPGNIGAWSINGNNSTTAANFIGTGDANDLIIKTGNTEKMRVTVTGKVGIGTNVPQMQLHVVSTDSAVALLENSQPLSSNVGNALYFKTGGGFFSYTGAIKTTGETASAARLGFFTFASATPNTLVERLSISNIGNVGIGTTNPDPAALLDLTASSKGLLLPRLTAAQKTIFPSPKAGLIIYQTDGVAGVYTYTITGWVHLISPGAVDNAWQFNGTDIYNSNLGNVGIGQIPSNLSKLTVLANSNTYGLLHTDGTVQIGTYVNPSSGQFGTRSNHRLSFFTNNGAEDITLLQNGNVGINTITPQTRLHVNPAGAGSILIGTNKNSGSYTNLEMGISAQTNGYSYIQSTKSSGSAYGNLLLNPYGGYVAINYSSDNNAGYPLDINQTDPDHALRIRNGIGVTPDNWDIHVNNNLGFFYNGIYKSKIQYTDGAYVTASDVRLKTNIQSMDRVIDRVIKLKAKSYEFIANNPTHQISTGFIAQEVLPLFPDLVSPIDYKPKNSIDKDPYYGINYAGFSVIAIKAIQEQQRIIESQNKRIEKLEQQMELLLKKIKAQR